LAHNNPRGKTALVNDTSEPPLVSL